MKKFMLVFVAVALLAMLFTGCAKDAAPDPAPAPDATQDPAPAPADAVTIKVGASPAPHAEVLEIARDILAEQNITLEIVEFDDYVLPNTALEEGDLDANYFQHITYLNGFNEEHGTHLVSVADIHYEPFAIYAGLTAALADLPAGAKIAVPDDGSNEARALLLLEANGLIKLAEGAGLNATKLDIVDNPNNYDIVEMEAKLLPQVLQDVDLAVINGNYALGAGLSADDALAFEDANEFTAPYINVLAVKEGNENEEAIQALVAALTSQQVKDFIVETYGNAVQPMF